MAAEQLLLPWYFAYLGTSHSLLAFFALSTSRLAANKEIPMRGTARILLLVSQGINEKIYSLFCKTTRLNGERPASGKFLCSTYDAVISPKY
jgi:hypothetical protein